MSGTIITGIMVLTVILTGWVWIFGARTKARLAAKYPAPGKLVDVGGHRLHINCQGQGGPTVVMESGNGDFSLTWARIQGEVARFTRICTYDRAGLGWSDRSPQPRTAHNLVADLHTLLERSGVEPPYVLVGHSLGGPLVRLYAHEHPDQVAGMVLVDAAHEEEFLRAPEVVKRLQPKSVKMMNGILRLMQVMISTGLFALVPRLYPRQALSMVPAEAHETYRGLLSSDAKGVAMIREEYATYEDHFAAVRAAHITSVGDIPLIVLSHGQLEQIPGLSTDVSHEFNQVFQQMQDELTAQSTRGKRIVAERSGHYIHIDQPELVIAAIREVVDAV